MWIAIVAVAVLVLVAAAYAGLGKLGEMPDTAVTDRPKGIVPSGPITREFLAEASLPTASSGYSRPQVDAYLAEIADGVAGSAHGVSFDVVRHGYDMQVIDELLDRPRVHPVVGPDSPGYPYGDPGVGEPGPNPAQPALQEPDHEQGFGPHARRALPNEE